MAIPASLVGFSGDATQKVSALGTGASTSEIILGPEAIFAIVSRGSGANALGGAFHIAFGNSGMAAAAATNFQFPGGQVFTLQTGDHTDRIRIYNPDATAIDVYIQRLDRF